MPAAEETLDYQSDSISDCREETHDSVATTGPEYGGTDTKIVIKSKENKPKKGSEQINASGHNGEENEDYKSPQHVSKVMDNLAFCSGLNTRDSRILVNDQSAEGIEIV